MKGGTIMKGKRMLFGMVIAGMLTIMAQPSVSLAYSYSGAWTSNDAEDLFAIELTVNSGPGSFYMYERSAAENDLLLLKDTILEHETVYFKEDSGHWYAGVDKSALNLNPGSGLDLGSSLEFGFYFKDNLDPSNKYKSYNVTVNDPGEEYILKETNTAMEVLVSDANPVPLPASILFLGSGVVGLIGFGRVRKNS